VWNSCIDKVTQTPPAKNTRLSKDSNEKLYLRMLVGMNLLLLDIK